MNGTYDGKELPQEVVDYLNAVKDHKDALKGFFAEDGDYNELASAGNAYNEAVDNYLEKVGEGSAEAGQTKVDTYNEKVVEYNTTKDTYNKAAETYKDAVKDYDIAVENRNSAIRDKNDTAAAENDSIVQKILGESVLGKDEDGNEKTLRDTLDVTAEELKAYDEIVVQIKDNNFASGIARDQFETEKEYSEAVKSYNAKIDSYNKVVTAYNKAIEDYNHALTQKLNEVSKAILKDDRFKGQNEVTFEETDAKENAWYTIGKVSVDNLFKMNPDDVKSLYASVGDGKDYWTHDYSSTDFGRDVYYWDATVNENGTREWNSVSANPKAAAEANKYLEDGISGFETAVTKKDNVTYYNENAKGSLDFEDVTSKWVLKVSDGANKSNDTDAYVAKGTNTFHLDGYLYVTKLASLDSRLLEKLPEIYVEKDTVDVSKAVVLPTCEAGAAPDINKTMDKNLATTGTLDAVNDVTTSRPDYKGVPSDGTTITPDEEKKDDEQPEEKDDETPDDTTTPEQPDETPEPEQPIETPEQPDAAPEQPVVTPDDITPEEAPERTPVRRPEGTPVVDLFGEEVPLTVPEIELSDEAVPLASIDEIGEVEIADEPVALAAMPAEAETLVDAYSGTIITDDDVPLADVPITGDSSLAAQVLALLSMAAGMLLSVFDRRRNSTR